MSTPPLCQHAAVKEVSPPPMFSPRLKEPKVVVIREEFIALTGDPLIAAVLNQLVYWSQRVTSLDLFLEEEKASLPKDGSSFQHGWFYKTSSELNEETMLCVTTVTLRRYLNFLEERGWIETRTNPQNKWDRTIQYRVNLRKLNTDLHSKGYTLPGFLKDVFLSNLQSGSFEEQKIKNLPSDVRPGGSKLSAEVKNDLSKLHKCNYRPEETADSNEKKQSFEGLENNLSKGKKLTSRMEKNLTSNTEITTENTNREHTQRTCVRENFSDLENLKNSENSILDESVSEEMIRLWERHVVQKLSPSNWHGTLHITVTRKGQLESLFAFHFQNDIRLWERFCLRVKGSHFLMGGGPNGWKVTLDWVLLDRNLLKILEGNFDDSNRFEQLGSSHECDLAKMQPNPVQDAEKAEIIASIKDPVWRNWCSQLAIGIRLNELQMQQTPLSLSELCQIANARFLECEDERLVWIGSSDQETLNKIEYLRLRINWVFAKEYPKARTLRTRLLEESVSLNEFSLNGVPLEQEALWSNPLSTKSIQQQGDIAHV